MAQKRRKTVGRKLAAEEKVVKDLFSWLARSKGAPAFDAVRLYLRRMIPRNAGRPITGYGPARLVLEALSGLENVSYLAKKGVASELRKIKK